MVGAGETAAENHQGSVGYEPVSGAGSHDALALVSHGRFDLSLFKGASFPLARIQEAFETLGERPGDLKTQITI